MARKSGDRVRVWSRNGRDWSKEFTAITEAIRALPAHEIIIDSELAPTTRAADHAAEARCPKRVGASCCAQREWRALVRQAHFERDIPLRLSPDLLRVLAAQSRLRSMSCLTDRLGVGAFP
jgi:hypothetical protein